MKILFFTPYFHPYISGMTVYAQLVLEELNKKHHLEVLTFKHISSLPKQDFFKKIRIFRMPFLFKISKGFISPQSIIIFIKKIRNKDLLIINLPSIEGLFLIILAKLTGKKVLAIFHCQIDLGSDLIAKFISLLVNLLVKLQLSLSTKIVAFSEDYIKSLNWPNKLKNKTVYIKPIIKRVKENSKTLKRLNEKKGKQFWVGFVGRIAKEKGLDYLLEAIKLLPNQNDYTLVFVGPKNHQVVGENKYYLNFLKKLKDSQINYLFLGLLSEEDLFAFYKCVDLIVLPSINRTEAYGLVQLEAMSVGTPVIASNLPGLREAIRETNMGILVPPKNAKKISEAINKILAHQDTWQLAKSQRTIEILFSKEDCIKSYEEIIDQIV